MCPSSPDLASGARPPAKSVASTDTRQRADVCARQSRACCEDVDTTADVITRLWRGWTTPENADAYEQFLLTRLFPSMRAIAGFRGADVLRRRDDEEIAFVTLTRFESLDAIRGFAGDDYEVPVLEPEAIALLLRYEHRAFHFATASFLV
jgi:hypothetical protein